MDAAQRQRLILELVPFSALVVKDFLCQYPQFIPIGSDLRQEAVLVLVALSYRYDDFDDLDHFRNYLRRSISNGCWDGVRSENVIQSPRVHKAQRRPFFEDGGNGSCEVGIPECSPENDDVEAPAEILHEGLYRELTSEEAMEAACESEADELIVEMAAKGLNMTEIARALSMGRKDVKGRALEILDRFRELY